MGQVESLYRLQQVDVELDEKGRRLQEVEAALGNTDELDQMKKKLQQVEKKYRQWQTTRQDLELKMKTLDKKIESSERRLYSGTVKNPKELKSYQEELVYLRRRKSSEEDDLLEAMINTEELEATWKDVQAQWEEAQAAWTANQAKLAQERNEIISRLAELSELRSTREQAVEPENLYIYEDLRQRKKGTAVARLQKNTCSSCHVQVPSSLVQQARQGESLIFCNSCERILYTGV